MAVVPAHYLERQSPFTLSEFNVHHIKGRDHLEAVLQQYGVDVSVKADGVGVVESFVSGLSRLLNEDLVLVEYNEHAISGSASAEAACYVQMNIDGGRQCGVGISRDIVAATLQAILCAVNAYLRANQKLLPMTESSVA